MTATLVLPIRALTTFSNQNYMPLGMTRALVLLQSSCMLTGYNNVIMDMIPCDIKENRWGEVIPSMEEPFANV